MSHYEWPTQIFQSDDYESRIKSLEEYEILKWSTLSGCLLRSCDINTLLDYPTIVVHGFFKSLYEWLLFTDIIAKGRSLGGKSPQTLKIGNLKRIFDIALSNLKRMILKTLKYQCFHMLIISYINERTFENSHDGLFSRFLVPRRNLHNASTITKKNTFLMKACQKSLKKIHSEVPEISYARTWSYDSIDDF